MKKALITNKEYLSSPNRTRHDVASPRLQYLQPFATRHGKSIVSANTYVKLMNKASIDFQEKQAIKKQRTVRIM